MLFNKITLEAQSKKLNFVTCVYLFEALFKGHFLVITLESLRNIYLLLKELQEFVYSSHSIPFMKLSFLLSPTITLMDLPPHWSAGKAWRFHLQGVTAVVHGC